MPAEAESSSIGYKQEHKQDKAFHDTHVYVSVHIYIKWVAIRGIPRHIHSLSNRKTNAIRLDGPKPSLKIHCLRFMYGNLPILTPHKDPRIALFRLGALPFNRRIFIHHVDDFALNPPWERFPCDRLPLAR